MAAAPKPKASWPIVVTAGVNDKIDFVVNGIAYVATVAAGTYYSASDLAAAVRAGLGLQGPFVGITTGLNDRIDVSIGGTPYVATLNGGWYTRGSGAGSIVGEVERALEAATGRGWSGLWVSSKIVVQLVGGEQFIMYGTAGANAARSALPTLGFDMATYGPAYERGATTSPAVNSNWPSVTVGTSGRFTLNAGGGAWQIKFATGANAATSIRHVIGFGAVDTASTNSHTGAYQHQNAWYADRPVRFDSKDRYDRLLAGDVSHAGRVRAIQLGDVRELRTIELAMLPPQKTKISREGANVNEAIERLWRDGAGRFRWWPDQTVEGTYLDYCLDPGEQLRLFNPARDRSGLERFGLTWVFRRYV